MNDAPLWPIAIHFGIVIILAAGILVASHLLGERHREASTALPYEGGIVGQGSARLRLSVKFYLIAMFFVVFDLEVVFLFAWAAAARESGLEF